MPRISFQSGKQTGNMQNNPERQALINSAAEMNQSIHAILQKFQKSGKLPNAQAADGALKSILENFYSACKQCPDKENFKKMFASKL